MSLVVGGPLVSGNRRLGRGGGASPSRWMGARPVAGSKIGSRRIHWCAVGLAGRTRRRREWVLKVLDGLLTFLWALIGAVMGTLGSLLVARSYYRKSSADLNTAIAELRAENDRLRRIVGALPRVVADPDSTRFKVDSEGLPTGEGLVHLLRASTAVVATSAASASLTVTPPFERSNVDYHEAEWDVRGEAIQAQLDAWGSDWQHMMFP